MGKLILCILLVLLLATAAMAEDKKVIDKDFIAVSSFLVLSSVFDTETTFAAIRNGAHEANPLLKGIVKSGRPATYGVMLASDVLIMGISYKMKHDGFRAWWVLPSVTAVGHTVAGGLNLRYVW